MRLIDAEYVLKIIGDQLYGEMSAGDANYCPNCGADMRGENDDIPIEYFESGGK